MTDDNWLARYFNNQKGEPLQVDEDMMFNDYEEFEYRYKYAYQGEKKVWSDNFGGYWNREQIWGDPVWSDWTTLNQRQFIKKMGDSEMKVAIYDTKKRKKVEAV